jgi:hypothetical protein
MPGGLRPDLHDHADALPAEAIGAALVPLVGLIGQRETAGWAASHGVSKRSHGVDVPKLRVFQALAARHVDVTDVAGAEGPGLDELELDRLGELAEDRLSRTEGGGLDIEPVLVDQTLSDQ